MTTVTVLSAVLLLVTVGLVALGAVLYSMSLVGWAQLAWVVASGTAGAGVMSLFEG